MTYDDAISIFKKHIQKLNQYGTDFEFWLSTAIEHVHDIFSILSPQHTSITQIKNDYTLERIRDKTIDLQNTYAYKAKQLIENFIEQLEEKKRVATDEITQKRKETANREENLKQQINNLKKNYNSLLSEKQKIEEDLNQIKNKPRPKKYSF
jgi:chromosome segregation ATPase